MSWKTLLAAAALVVGLGFVGTPANAGTTFASADGICPNTLGHDPFGGGSTGTAVGCNEYITFNLDGSIATTAGNQVDYDGVDDATVGIINNTLGTIFAINLSSLNDIGGFDSDGINGYVSPPSGSYAGNGTDTTGYGGEQAYFTNNNITSLTVNFIGGIAPGATGYFSLEDQVDLNLVVSNAPEPASLALMGTALIALAAVRRRKR